jgi:hypothetical protein
VSDIPAHEVDRHPQAWVLKAGQWSLTQDPVADGEVEGELRDYDEAIKAAGYTS